MWFLFLLKEDKSRSSMIGGDKHVEKEIRQILKIFGFRTEELKK